MEFSEGELPVLSPGTLFDHPNRIGSGDEEAPNPETRGEKEEKQEIGPVDSLEIKDEREDEASSIKTPAVGDGGGPDRGSVLGPVRGPVS